ncbi:hypothetical protein [Amycolatopsis sp. lyj-23]|uniref:hypothetical protein n=1 Tax=Amycolatopsis sp. lyj-23 TaxID=2789283 RepID=UPI00397C851A
MDDNYRLIKLLSLVAWTENEAGDNRYDNFPRGGKWGMRYRARQRQELTAKEQEAALNMCMHYAGAVDYHQGTAIGVNEEPDQRQLPRVTLAFVTGLADSVVAVLGRMVCTSLRLSKEIDPTAMGRKWVGDVTDTSWRLLLTGYEDCFGQRG